MKTRIIEGLLWREWLLHRGELRWIFSAWLFGIWVFPIHPAMFLIPFGVLSACVIAPTFGGSDVAEGTEEFSFSLPPTRSQRYLTRLGLGGGALAAMLLVGILAGLFNLPQKVWGLVFDSTLTTPFTPISHGVVYVLAFVLPMATFIHIFVSGSHARTPEDTGLLWLTGLFLMGILTGLGLLAERIFWRDVTGWISVPALVLWSTGRLAFGYVHYRLKEGVSGLPPLGRIRHFWIWIVIAIVTAFVLIALCTVPFRG